MRARARESAPRGGFRRRSGLRAAGRRIVWRPHGTTYAGDRRAVGRLLQCWLARTDTRLFAVDRSNVNYVAFVNEHPGWFSMGDRVEPYGWTLYRAQVPRLTVRECEEAARASPR